MKASDYSYPAPRGQRKGYAPLMALRPDDARVRAAINAIFVERGGPPEADELMARTNLPRDQIFDALRRLADAGSITLRPGTLDVWTAPPFSATPTVHHVTINTGQKFWAGCAWCALGICALVGPGRIHSLYGGEDTPFDLDVDAHGPRPLGDTCVHFAVPAKRWAESLGYACATILFFASPDDEHDWLERTRLPAGRIVPLEQTWRLASAFFGGSTQPGPHTRHRSDVDALFRSVGLDDPFFLLK
jgi:Alkylmercury lyase